jgi:hypothetical protein
MTDDPTASQRMQRYLERRCAYTAILPERAMEAVCDRCGPITKVRSEQTVRFIRPGGTVLLSRVWVAGETT